MEVLLDRRWRKHGASRPGSKVQRRILPDVKNRVEAGYVPWQSVCPFCNLSKYSNLSGIDEVTRQMVKPFHPRRMKWRRHFRNECGEIVGLSAIGRVTVAVLGMNDGDRVELRASLIEEGLYKIVSLD